MSIFGELKRRNVFRVAIAYSIVAWLVAQVAELALDSFGAPDWVMKTLLLLLVLGLPIAVIFAWAFEMTPEGVKREKDVDRSASITQETGQKINYIIIGGLTIALLFSIGTHRWTTGTPGPASDTMEVLETDGHESIAVLPFVNMSDDPNNEYFSDGISEELLNVLVRVEGLRVASRTSSFAFKGKDTSIPQIANSLGVDHILEGSVRKAGTTVRVTAQLIDARTDKHLWSETYDRKLEDIFAIQDEISAHIVEALKVALGAGGEAAIENSEAPTENLEAYENYLRGRYFWQMRGGKNIATAIELFEKATTLDPAFARAWSSLASAHITMPTYSDEPGEDHYPQALIDARKALAIDPTIAEAHAVLADLARMDHRWSAAEAHYQNAIENEPKNSTSHLWYAEHLLATGRRDAALDEAVIAYQLDPLSPGTNSVLGYAYWFDGDNAQAEKYTRQAVQLGHIGAILDLGDMMMERGRFEEALALATDFEAKLVRLDGVAVARVAAYRDDDARQAYFDRINDPTSQIPKTYFVSDYANLGRLDEAFAIASDVRSFEANSLFAFWRQNMATFRSDPRFVEIIQSAGYIGYWDEYGWPPDCARTTDTIVCQ